MAYNQRCLGKNLVKFLVSSAICATSFDACGSGFKLPVQNVTNMGTAYAGTASLAIDASTNFYNPAGLTRLCEEQLVMGGGFNFPYTQLTVSRATDTAGNPLSPSFGRTVPSGSAFVPFFHYAKRIDDNWLFGFSSVTTFGTRINYADNSIVRYMNTRSELKTVDLAPSLALCVGNGFSIGVGVNALYAMNRLNARIGTGSLDTDGRFDNDAENWGYGYHAGILYEFDDCTRVGLNYHSKIKVNLEGTSRIQLAAGAPISSLGITSKVTLPEFAALSLFHAFNETWAVMADFQYVGWHTFNQLVLKFDNSGVITTKTNYKNAYFVALGGTYQYDDHIQLKLGGAFDKTPTRDNGRQLFNPDQNQTYAAIGAQYRFNKCVAIDLGYTHVFYKKANIDVRAGTSVNTLQGLQSVQGVSRSRIDVLGMQVTWDIM